MSLVDEEGKLAFQEYCLSSKSVVGINRDDGKVDVAVMDLLDEYWFFRNTLVAIKPPNNSVHVNIASSQEKDRQKEKEYIMSTHSAAISSYLDQINDFSSEAEFSACPRHPLLRLPTVFEPPSPPRLIKLEDEEEDEDEGALILNSPYRKLRHSMSSLEYQSASSSSSSSPPYKKTSHDNLSRSGGKGTVVKVEKTERYRAILHYIARESYYRKTFTEKKWRSLSELEYMEVQGLRDLGFVYDKEGLNGMIINHDKKIKAYVSDTFNCFDTKSTQDMKDQLRFWAKAVASNTRQYAF